MRVSNIWSLQGCVPVNADRSRCKAGCFAKRPLKPRCKFETPETKQEDPKPKSLRAFWKLPLTISARSLDRAVHFLAVWHARALALHKVLAEDSNVL